MAKWLFARQVVEDHEVAERVDELCKEHDRFGDAFEALKWLLARKCSELTCLTRTVSQVEYSLCRQSGDALAGTPDITVLYTFDDNEVAIIGITAEKVESPED